mgnify:CR=1 FL=1
MYHLERREFDQVLAHYDGQFRNLGSALTQAMPDLYIDVQNAASMLFRLQRHGVDVGDRWTEFADKAEARIGDCLSAFTLPHWMMALAATGRFQAGARMLDAMHDFASRNAGTAAEIVRESGIPVCQAVLAHARGDHAGAVALMRPALGAMYRMGGSHAQQDVLEQLFLDAAMKAGLEDDVRMLLERVAGQHPVPPERRIGQAAYRRVLGEHIEVLLVGGEAQCAHALAHPCAHEGLLLGRERDATRGVHDLAEPIERRRIHLTRS